MTGTISLRPASSRDYGFALDLYLETMQPFTSEFIAWNEAKQRESVARNWNAANTRIIFAGRRKIGWMQIQEKPSEIFLQQFFIAPDQQRRGIGTAVLDFLVPVWNAAGKPVTLTVLRNNPARRLYERFGFLVAGEEGVKLRMQR
jgi:ribosomal protein S18 acetylase RimI-like enzyme